MTIETPTPPAGDQGRVCTWPALATPYAGAACPGCGHTNLAHPGEANPALDECILCRVQVSVDDLVAWCGILEARVDSLERIVQADEVDVLALVERVDALEARAATPEAGA